MKRKIIATDMDGTFLDASGRYNQDHFARVLDLCESKDCLFTIASGRGLLALDKLFEPFKDRIAMVAENGSLVRYQNDVLFERHLTRQHCLDVIQALDENPYGFGHLFLMSGHLGSYIIKGADEDYIEQEKHYHENIKIVDSFEAINDTIIKITAHLQPDKMEDGTAWLNQRLPDLTVVTTGFEAIDIILKDVHKGIGLKYLCQKLNLSSADVVVFGDNLNDLEMMTFAGHAVAVSNARPEIKSVADEIIGHHDDGVVLTYTENYLR